MPKQSKKRVKQKLDLKQKKLLKTRLIRISMVIDDYVYKNKHISTNEAKAFVEEVSNYKLQCEKDVRSLQVIEKITRCMNAIINEHQEDNGDTNNSQNTSENYCPSPVYSLPEEDKTMLSQNPTNLDANAGNENNISNDFATIDLCNDKDIIVKRNIQVDVEIHRAMSTLSIRENDYEQSRELMMNSQDLNMIDCSQSILMDFNANREEEIRKMSKDRTQAKISKPKTFVPPYVHTSVAKNDCSQSILKEFNPMMTEPAQDNKSSSIRPQIEIQNKPSTKLNATTNKDNIPGKNKNTKKNIVIKNVRFSNNIDAIDLTEGDTANKKKRERKCKATKGFDKIKSKTGKQNKDGRKKKINVKTTIVSKETTKIPTTTINKRIEDICVNKTNNVHATLPLHNTNTSLNETVHQKTQSTYICEHNNSIYSKSMTKIYNANIENDLSWMENIRYVREISSDEFDPKYASLTSRFWENFDLPNEWNEKDFDL